MSCTSPSSHHTRFHRQNERRVKGFVGADVALYRHSGSLEIFLESDQRNIGRTFSSPLGAVRNYKISPLGRRSLLYLKQRWQPKPLPNYVQPQKFLPLGIVLKASELHFSYIPRHSEMHYRILGEQGTPCKRGSSLVLHPDWQSNSEYQSLLQKQQILHCHFQKSQCTPKYQGQGWKKPLFPEATDSYNIHKTIRLFLFPNNKLQLRQTQVFAPKLVYKSKEKAQAKLKAIQPYSYITNYNKNQLFNARRVSLNIRQKFF